VRPASPHRFTPAGSFCSLRIDCLGTPPSAFLVNRFTCPHPLHIQCWPWLAATSRTTEEDTRCLNAILQLDRDTDAASLALLLLAQQPTGS
jgi:hypothetical protein